MTTIQKLNRIEQEKAIYNIHYCLAGVGFQFYEPPNGYGVSPNSSDWKKYLITHRYYSTFVEAVDAEYERLFPASKALDKSSKS